jgi:hypothetical protein
MANIDSFTVTLINIKKIVAATSLRVAVREQ